MKNRIKELRKKNGWTQEALAPKLGIAQNSLSCWENEISEPDNSSLCKLADLFKCSVDYILYRTDDPSTAHNLNINEVLDVGQFNDTPPLFFILGSKEDTYVMYGKKQTALIKKSAKSGIYFHCSDELISFNALNKALNDAEPLFSFVSPNGTMDAKLPKSIRAVIKVDGEKNYTILNNTPFEEPAVPLTLHPQEQGKLIAHGSGQSEAPEVDYEALHAAHQDAKKGNK